MDEGAIVGADSLDLLGDVDDGSADATLAERRAANSSTVGGSPTTSAKSMKLYKGRASVEREFGQLKNEALLPLRVRGLDRVALHAD